jgi:hypothetical protein
MRKHQQRQILELIQTLGEAQSLGMFARCRDGALRIAEFIRHIEGEGGGARTIALLEEYRELLPEADHGGIDMEPPRARLIELENSVRSELAPNRIEVVFFPYQLSMFDALESVYLAARADPDCDAHVVPIPWYELNPDGTLGQMNYDGDDYPDTIPVTNWLEYDVEARHPDVIFTHYPYDENVNNASIHPLFYSKRLRAFTELLCYIPYFVDPDDKVAEYSGGLPGVVYAHRVIVQSEAVRKLYIAHYRKFDEENGWKGRFGRAEEKFVALGSPKFDKVMNTKRGDAPLPEEWRKRIQRPDGSARKVVLYNTHMFAWIRGGEAYFRKLRSVFELFRGREDIVIWWRPHPNTELNFRAKAPQLLGEYKNLVAEYRRGGWGIYDDTPDLHRAIAFSDAYYGDMSSLVPMYQVTGKSVMTQNAESAKPGGKYSLIIEKNGCSSEEPIENYKNYLQFDNLCETENYYWASPLTINGLFRIDKQTWKCELVDFFPNEVKTTWRLYANACHHDGKLYFAPHNAERIAIFDLVTHEWITVDVPEPPKEKCEKYNPPQKFWQVIEHDGLIYFLPSLYPGILMLDPRTLEISVMDGWVEEYNDLFFMESTSYFNRFTLTSDKLSVLLVSACTSAVVQLDFDSRQTVIHEIGEKKDGYCDIIDSDIENEYWLVSTITNSLVQYNAVTKRAERYSFDEIVRPLVETAKTSFKGIFDGNSYNTLDKFLFGKIVRHGGIIYLFPLWFEKAIKFDLNSKQFLFVENFDPADNSCADCDFNKTDSTDEPEKLYNRWIYRAPFFNLYCIKENTLLMHTQRTNKLVEFNLKTHEYRERGIEIEPEDRARIKNFLLQLPEDEWQKPRKSVYELVLHENNENMFGVTLEEYLDAITSEPKAEWLRKREEVMSKYWKNIQRSKSGIGSAGKEIYEFVKKLCV